MRTLSSREIQILERRHGAGICPLTAIVQESVSMAAIPETEKTLIVFKCGYDRGTARYGRQSRVVESAAITPCPLSAAEQCELYLAHLKYKLQTIET